MSDTDSSVNVTKISKLEFHDPLYLHPSDTSGASLIIQKLKGTDNYNVWSCAMKLVLHTKNNLGFIDGSCARFPYEDDDVLLEVYNGKIFSKTAESVWFELKKPMRKLMHLLHLIYIKISIHIIKLVSPYLIIITKLNAMWREFYDMNKIDDMVSANQSFQDHSQSLKLVQFLMGLDDVYTPIISQILTSDPVPNVKVAFSIVSRDKSHRMHSSISYMFRNQSSAFTSKNIVSNVVVNNYNKNNNTNNSGNRIKYKNPPLKCTNHNMLGHTVDRCYELIRYPPGYIKKPFNQGAPRFNSSNCVSDKIDAGNSSIPLTSEQIMKLLSLVNEKPVTHHANANMTGWIIKSEANQHMVSSSQKLDNVIDVSNLKLSVNRSNGTVVKILQMGNLKLSNNIVLSDVLVIPQYCFSSNMSVRDLSKQKTWHNRLGHPAYQVLSVLGEKLRFNKTDNYDPCIVHQTSCAYTPQENGIAEIKHRHLLNVPRSLMFQGGRDNTKDEGNHVSQSDSSNETLSDGVPVTSIAESIVTQAVPEGTINTETNTDSESQLRRSSRQTVLPKRFNDYVLNDKAKFDLNKYLNYSKLGSENYYFDTCLIRGHKPKSFIEAVQNQN
ncbi:uncharacterized protein [Rutidosis leptorrhynchoides]|uniref:uncharacterized protein n=1 Tax=Rutidosis leptorrhynchoides TaxID=125765 RepID=UPI003A995291